MIGGGTARADDPMLTARDIGASHQPVRIVATRAAALPPEARMLGRAPDVPLWICHAPQADTQTAADAGAKLIEVPLGPDGFLSPEGLLTALAVKGLTRVFCEGGGTLAASLLRAGLVDDLIVMQAGTALGAEAIPGVGPMAIAELVNAPRFDLLETRALGQDVMTVWTRR